MLPLPRSDVRRMVVWERISLERHLCQIGESINLFIPSKAIKSNGIYNIPIISVNSHKQTSTLHPHTHTKNNTNSQKYRTFGAVEWENKRKTKIYCIWKKSHRTHTGGSAISSVVWLFAFFNEIILDFWCVFLIYMWLCSADDFQVVHSSISWQHDCIRCSGAIICTMRTSRTAECNIYLCCDSVAD